MTRHAQIDRRTSETKIQLELIVDGKGASRIATKIPFFDHMLTLFSRHSLCDLALTADGDIEVDLHHTVEDTGIALGQAFTKALGDKRGIRRYGWAYLPMDETLARVVVDFSGRPFLAYKAPEGVASIGAFSFTLLEEFLRAFMPQRVDHAVDIAGTVVDEGDHAEVISNQYSVFSDQLRARVPVRFAPECRKSGARKRFPIGHTEY